MSDSSTHPSVFQSELGGYPIVRELQPGATALAMAPGNRPVVLKTLDPDCLVRSAPAPRLHPSIRDRLARVRELALVRVANLHGVEHDRGIVYLVWEYIPGQTLDEWAAAPTTTAKDVLLMTRELILTVEALHARGIVHGAIHSRNVIVDARGQLKLTHISPLLYHDPAHDLAGLAALFAELAALRGDESGGLCALADETAGSDGGLRAIGARATSWIDLRRDAATDTFEHQADTRRRLRSRLGALAVLAAAIVLVFGIKRYASDLIPKPPRPPEAPASMLE